MSLHDRCKEFYETMGINRLLRQSDPVADLVAFVTAEIGRSADPLLKESLPLCLYFRSADDREGFIAAIREAKPGMMMKKLP